MPPSDPENFQGLRSASPQDLQKKIQLSVSSGDQGTEIFVIDSKFDVAARGKDSLHASLLPGIYKIKVKAGRRIHEEFVVLAPGESQKSVTVEPLQIVSAAPLKGAARAHVAQQQCAVHESHVHHVTHGSGSSLYFFVRNGKEEVLSIPEGATFELCDSQGKVIVDLVRSGVHGSERNSGWAACNVSVAPGLYRLRHRCTTCMIEQTLVASPGWQTQLFAVCKKHDDSPYPEINLADSSIFMRREGEGFVADDPEKRLTEIARQALAQGRMVLSQRLIDEILGAKFSDPMLGIYGAHLLLAQKDRSDDLRIVVANLRRLLVDPHPDVESLALQLADRGSDYVFEVPPMLRRSWAAILNATVTHPGLIKPGSLAEKIASSVMDDEPWLLTGSKNGGAERGDEDLEEIVKSVLQEATMPGKMRRREIAHSLLRPVQRSFEALGAAPWWQTKLDDTSIGQLVENLGIPRGKLQAMLDRLTRAPERKQDEGGTE